MPIPATRYFRRKVILAKIEDTPGTDAVPSASANAIEARNVSITALDTDAVENDVIQAYYGQMQEFVTAARVKLSYETALQGSGAVGTPPAFGPLLRACGMAEVITLGTSVVYSPITSSQEATTQYVYVDGVLHKLLCVRGNVSLNFTPKSLARAKFDFVGLFSPVTDAALPSVTMTAWKTPVPVNNRWTSGFALHGLATAMYDLSVDLGNQVQHRDDIVGAEDVQITDRKMTGKVTIQAPKIADYDFYTAANSSTLAPLALTHGTTAGFRVRIAAPKVQVKAPVYGEKAGVATNAMDLRLVPNAGNDELVLTFD